MKVLIVNPILYTSENRHIKRAGSIKDCMIYDLSLAFYEQGHEVVLYAAEPFQPLQSEEYPFEVIWGKSVCKRILMPHCFPFMPSLAKYLKQYGPSFDLIITSEVFSLNSLVASRQAPGKIVCWHELAKHNALMKKIPSHIWYGVVARLLMRKTAVVARSESARIFISQYCKNTREIIIEHGVNLNKFPARAQKNNYFVVCSQLIERKRIDGIIQIFKRYLEQVDAGCALYIVGDGELAAMLKALVKRLAIEEKVHFTGRMNHEQLLPVLAGAKAMLVNTVKDNSMISIVEAIAVGTPVITTAVPLNVPYIRSNGLGIVDDNWDVAALQEISVHNAYYVENCLSYRREISTLHCVKQFETLCAKRILPDARG